MNFAVMNYFMQIGFAFLLSLFVVPAARCQINEENEGSDQTKILADWKLFQYTDTSVSTIKFPQRKYDSPFFCDELIPYKNGYIINSITTSPGGRTIDIRTPFYYYDLATNKIAHLVLPGVDTIESIATDGNNGLYCSYIKAGLRIISFSSPALKQTISSSAQIEIKAQFDTAKWIKLGYAGDILYALSPDALFMFSENRWKQVVKYSLDDFYLKALNYRRSGSILPTKNITIQQNCVWFLQEIVQQRTCHIFKLDIKTGVLSDFFISRGYIDNYLKQVNDYTVLPNQTILVSASRLMGNNLVLSASEKETDVWIFNNRLKTASGEVMIAATTSAIDRDTAYLAGINGLFMKYQETVTPLIFWSNTHQEVKENKFRIDFQFVPRSLIKLPNNQFLIGGMWGGLYLLDLNTHKIICVDDIPEKKVTNLQLDKL